MHTLLEAIRDLIEDYFWGIGIGLIVVGMVSIDKDFNPVAVLIIGIILFIVSAMIKAWKRFNKD